MKPILTLLALVTLATAQVANVSVNSTTKVLVSPTAAQLIAANPTLGADLSGYVPITRTINGHALNANVTITKSDLSLGSVENTALSTWAGGTSITTLGTIATGTWHGTAVADAYIASAATWNAKESAIAAGTTSQYWRGDKSWQTLNATVVGLGNVENTALSTWAGGTSVTTLGTIATGTWQGTAVAVANGGTGQTNYTNGQILIGNTTGNTLTKATLTGTANQITVTPGAGSITLSLPQSIATASSPTFAGMFLANTSTALTATGSGTSLLVRNSATPSAYISVQTNSIVIGTNTNFGAFYPTALTGNRTWNLPDADTKLPVSAQHLTWLGPTAARSYTLPDAAATLLTTNAVVTVAQGGTGVATITAYAPIFGGTTGTGAVQSGTVGTAGQVLTSNGAGALPTFQQAGGGGAAQLPAWTYTAGTIGTGLFTTDHGALNATSIITVTDDAGAFSAGWATLPAGSRLCLLDAAGETSVFRIDDVSDPGGGLGPRFTVTIQKNTSAGLWVAGRYQFSFVPGKQSAADVALGNVDNTSDANKPLSTAQQTALDLKANLASPTFTGTVTIPSGASIADYAPLASPTFSGTPVLPTDTTGVTQAAANNSTKLATTAYVDAQGVPFDTGWTANATGGDKTVAVANYTPPDFSGGDTIDITKLNDLAAQVQALTKKLQALEAVLAAQKLPNN